MKRPKFTASLFTPTEFDDAVKKARIANRMVKFLSEGCNPEKFDAELYHHTMQHLWHHIAHYNRYGFIDAWFSRVENKVAFVERILDSEGGYGDPHYTWVDVEKVVRAWVAETGLVDVYREALRKHIEAAERAELSRLRAKYEVTQE